MLKVYGYKGCSTCRSATRWLNQHGIPHEPVAIRETPPALSELKSALHAKKDLRALFNVSGQDYRALQLKDRLPDLSTDAALELLASHGNLVKRPFAIDAERGVHLVGFKEPEWQVALL